MAGIYIHIPFCKKACHYCNFHFSTSLHRKPALLQALHKEIEAAKHFHPYLNDQPIETLYLGGGTPSLLTIQELAALLAALQNTFQLESTAEITLEANPDDIEPTRLQDWRRLGINRLSIGTQSFFDEDLKWMNRAHNAMQAILAIEYAHQEGFDNLNIDLIFGTPTLSDKNWISNLEKASALGIDHLSCYALTVEEKTALHYFIKKGKTSGPEESGQVQHFELLQQWAESKHWDHYEISNLCKPQHRSRHNSNYWKGKPYVGFGPSAHSFDGETKRMIGVPNNALYIMAWLETLGEPYEIETLSETQRLNEKIMTGLRLSEGIAFDKQSKMIVDTVISEKKWRPLIKQIMVRETNGHILLQNNRMTLSQTGRLFADAISAELFL